LLSACAHGQTTITRNVSVTIPAPSLLPAADGIYPILTIQPASTAQSGTTLIYVEKLFGSQLLRWQQNIQAGYASVGFPVQVSVIRGAYGAVYKCDCGFASGCVSAWASAYGTYVTVLPQSRTPTTLPTNYPGTWPTDY